MQLRSDGDTQEEDLEGQPGDGDGLRPYGRGSGGAMAPTCH